MQLQLLQTQNLYLFITKSDTSKCLITVSLNTFRAVCPYDGFTHVKKEQNTKWNALQVSDVTDLYETADLEGNQLRS